MASGGGARWTCETQIRALAEWVTELREGGLCLAVQLGDGVGMTKNSREPPSGSLSVERLLVPADNVHYAVQSLTLHVRQVVQPRTLPFWWSVAAQPRKGASWMSVISAKAFFGPRGFAWTDSTQSVKFAVQTMEDGRLNIKSIVVHIHFQKILEALTQQKVVMSTQFSQLLSRRPRRTIPMGPADLSFALGVVLRTDLSSVPLFSECLSPVRITSVLSTFSSVVTMRGFLTNSTPIERTIPDLLASDPFRLVVDMILYDMRGVPILWESAYVTLSATDVSGLGVFELCTIRSPQGFWLRLNAISKTLRVPNSSSSSSSSSGGGGGGTTTSQDPPSFPPPAVTTVQTQFRFIDLYVPLQQLNNWFSTNMSISDTLTKLPRM